MDEGLTVSQLAAPALPENVAVLRGQLRSWLEKLRWPPEQLHDLLVAVNEAVSNTVQHAYPPPVNTGWVQITVTVSFESTTAPTGGFRWARIVVSDHGRWQPDHNDRSRGRRGLGLLLMQALMDEVVVVADPRGGTEVNLLSPAVPIP